MRVRDAIHAVNALDVDRGVRSRLPDRTITISAAEVFCECPAQYDFAYNSVIQPVGYKSALTLGTASHEGIEALKHGGDLSEACMAAEQVIEEELSRVGEYVDGEALAQARRRGRYDQARARAMVACYRERYHTRPDGGDIDLEFVELERKLGPMLLINPATGCASRTFAVAGRNDGTAKLVRRDIRAQWELKTTSEAPADLVPALKIGLQIPVYQWMVTQTDKVAPDATFIDFILKPTIRPLKAGKRRQADETSEEFETRAVEAYRKEPERFFLRHELAFDEQQIRVALATLWEVCRAIRTADRFGYLAPRGRRCRKSFGFCDYRALCWYGDRSGYRLGAEAHEELGLES